jgi:hypothetical protein
MKAKKAYFASMMLPAALADPDTAGDGELLALAELIDNDATGVIGAALLMVIVGVDADISDGTFADVIVTDVSDAAAELELSHTPVTTLGQQGSLATKVQLFEQVVGHCG